MRHSILLIVLCVVGWMLLKAFSPSDSAPGLGPDEPVVEGVRQEPLDGVQPLLERQEVEPVSVPTGTSPAFTEPIQVEGVVVDEVFGAGLYAEIRKEDGTADYSSPDSGHFSIDTTCGLTGLLIRSNGFEAKQVALPRLDQVPPGPIDLGRILLKPKNVACLRLVSPQGVPATGVKTLWSSLPELVSPGEMGDWMEETPSPDANSFEALSDLQGCVSVAIAKRSLVSIHSPEGQELARVTIRPRENIEFTLPSCLATVRFIDFTTKEPIAGKIIGSWRPDETDSVAMQHTTDLDGAIQVLPCAHPVSFAACSGRRRDLWTSDDSRALLSSSENGRWGEMSLSSLSCGESVTIEILRSSAWFRVIHSETRRELDQVHYRIDENPPDLDSGPVDPNRFSKSVRCLAAHRDRAYRFETNDGVIRLQVEENARNRGNGTSRKVANPTIPLLLVDGFEPYRLTEWDKIHEGWHGTIELVPAEQRSLRIHHRGGEAYQGPVEVYSPKGAVLVFKSPGHWGRGEPYGPFDWYGGPLDLVMGGTKRQLSEEQLQANHWIDVELTSAVGVLEIRHVPATFLGTIEAVSLGDGAWTRHFSSTALGGEDGGTITIPGLSPGTYLVGPEHWIRGSLSHNTRRVSSDMGVSIGKHPYQVQAGQTTIADWQSEWSASSTVGGFIDIKGDNNPRPFLVPIYALGESGSEYGPHVFFNRNRRNRIPIGPDGKYSIDAGQPLPSLIAVCVPRPQIHGVVWGDSSALVVLETILPGESCLMELGTIHLEWEGEEFVSDGMAMGFDLERSLRYPINGPVAALRDNWRPNAAGNTHTLNNIPLSVTALLFHRISPKDPVTGKRSYMERRIGLTWNDNRSCHLKLSLEKFHSYPERPVN